MNEFRAQLSANAARRLLRDLEAHAEGRPMTRDERRRADRYRERIATAETTLTALTERDHQEQP